MAMSTAKIAQQAMDSSVQATTQVIACPWWYDNILTATNTCP